MSAISTDMIEFFAAPKFAVVGASNDRKKFGNKVFRWYLNNSLDAVPINPTSPEIESIPTLKSLSSLPLPQSTSVSIITPPAVTLNVVREAADLGITHLWLQPGAESVEAVELAKEKGLSVVYGGPCILELGEKAKRMSKKLQADRDKRA